MSDSTPNRLPVVDRSGEQGAGSTEHGLQAPGSPLHAVASPGALSPRWWAASIGFHALLLGWLVFFSPVRVFDPDAKPAAGHVSADRAREVIEQIRDEQASSLEDDLRALDDIRGKMAELEGRKRAEFAAFAAEMGKDCAGQGR